MEQRLFCIPGPFLKQVCCRTVATYTCCRKTPHCVSLTGENRGEGETRQLKMSGLHLQVFEETYFLKDHVWAMLPRHGCSFVSTLTGSLSKNSVQPGEKNDTSSCDFISSRSFFFLIVRPSVSDSPVQFLVWVILHTVHDRCYLWASAYASQGLCFETWVLCMKLSVFSSVTLS